MIIDTQKEYTFTQFALVQREGSNYVKAGNLQISSDKKNWETVGNFSLKQESGAQVFGVTPTKGRYLSPYAYTSASAELFPL